MGALKVLPSLMHRKRTRSSRYQSETIHSRNVGLEGKRPHYIVQGYNEENPEEFYFLPVFILPFFSSSPPAFLAFFLCTNFLFFSFFPSSCFSSSSSIFSSSSFFFLVFIAELWHYLFCNNNYVLFTYAIIRTSLRKGLTLVSFSF